MTHDLGCHGRVRLGSLPGMVQQKLARLPGEWLEFDPASGDVVVRRVQPAAGASLPTVAMELLRMLSSLPSSALPQIVGGELVVEGDEQGHLARLRVEAGGVLHVEWAHPDEAWGRQGPYRGRIETAIDPKVQRLTGGVTFLAARPEPAARELQNVGDTFEGLYPEGQFRAVAGDPEGVIVLEMRDANVDAHLVVEALERLAVPGSISGAFTVGAFADELPEEHIRIVFERGRPLAQHPLLWSRASAN